MTITRRTALLVLSLFIFGCGLILILAILGPLLQGPAGPELPGVHWLREDIALPMNFGDSCWTNNRERICSDVFRLPRYPAEKHILAIGNTLELFFDEPFPEFVEAELRPAEDLDRKIVVEAETDNNGRVLVTVPENLSGNYTLLVDARWINKGDSRGHGDAWYTTPVRFDQ
jgi:hypothetical protein